MKKLGSKKFIFIALIIFLLLVIAGVVLDRMTQQEALPPPQGRSLGCNVEFLDEWRFSV